MNSVNRVLRFISRKALWLMHLPARCWLIAGLIVINAGAAIPFGISSSGDSAPLTPFEMFVSAIFAVVAIAYFFTIKNNKALNYVSTLSGGLWFGVAIGSFVENVDKLDIRTTMALTLLPMGIGIVSFALERISVQSESHTPPENAPI
jgi:hypothetical protein